VKQQRGEEKEKALSKQTGKESRVKPGKEGTFPASISKQGSPHSKKNSTMGQGERVVKEKKKTACDRGLYTGFGRLISSKKPGPKRVKGLTVVQKGNHRQRKKGRESQKKKPGDAASGRKSLMFGEGRETYPLSPECSSNLVWKQTGGKVRGTICLQEKRANPISRKGSGYWGEDDLGKSASGLKNHQSAARYT